MQTNNNQAQPLIVLKILWGAILFSTFMYFFILTTSKLPAANSDAPSPILIPLAAMAVIVFVLSFIIPGIMLRTTARKLVHPYTMQSMVTAYFVPFILRIALCEAVALFGFVLAFTVDKNYYFPFWAAAILGFLLAFPSEANVTAAVERAKG